jgi:hypothetical protein
MAFGVLLAFTNRGMPTECALTLRSSADLHRHGAAKLSLSMIRFAAPRRWRPLSSNVRPHEDPMRSQATLWICRVCGQSCPSQAEVCVGCGCPSAASDDEVTRRLASQKPLPLRPKSISMRLVVGVAGAWLAVLLASWLLRGPHSTAALVLWLSGAYMLRYLVLRWHGRRAPMGVAEANSELGHGWRFMLDLTAVAFVLFVVWSLMALSPVAA